MHYRLYLSKYLAAIPIHCEALLCRDVSCCNPEHAKAINVYANDTTAACISAAELAVPQACSRQQSRCIPGWSEYVQPFRDKSLFWHRMWLDCGRPRSGVVFECMKRSRLAYHYAIRKVRKDAESIKSERVAASLLCNSLALVISGMRLNGSGPTLPVLAILLTGLLIVMLSLKSS